MTENTDQLAQNFNFFTDRFDLRDSVTRETPVAHQIASKSKYYLDGFSRHCLGSCCELSQFSQTQTLWWSMPESAF